MSFFFFFFSFSLSRSAVIGRYYPDFKDVISFLDPPLAAMASAHHLPQQSSRYPQSHSNSRDDSVRLPSLKDLNFDYQRGHRPQDSPQTTTDTTQDNSPPRHPTQSWARSSHSTQTASPMPPPHHQQQHTPPLSAPHDSKIDYPSKPDNAGFMTPGLPLSAQTTPVPGSLNTGLGPRGDDQSQAQSKRSRKSSNNMGPSRDLRHVISLFALFSVRCLNYFH